MQYNNPNTCLNPPKYLIFECDPQNCIYWEGCIYENKGESKKVK